MKTRSQGNRLVRGVLVFLILSILLSIFPFAASAASTVENGAMRVTLVQNEDDTATLSLDVMGASLARTQCIALAYDTSRLTLLDTSGDAVPLPTQNAPLSSPAVPFAVPTVGWETESVPSELTLSKNNTGILVLYATAERAHTYTSYQTVLHLTFACDSRTPIADSALRLLNATEQGTFGQSVKAMLANASDHVTYGSLSTGNTLAKPIVSLVPLAEETWVNIFKDIKGDEPFYDAIEFVGKNGLFVGDDYGNYKPYEPMTRETFAAAICRLAGAEEAAFNAPTPEKQLYPDVKLNRWSAPYITWATENGIFVGSDVGTFMPKKEITRQEMYLVMLNFAESFGYDAAWGDDVDLSVYPDGTSVPKWTLPGIKFAAANNLLVLDDENTIRSRGAAARWELATLLQEFVKIPKRTAETATLSDVEVPAQIKSRAANRAARAIYDGVYALDEEIDLRAYNLTTDDLHSLYQRVVKVAEFFYVNNRYRYRHDGNGIVTALIPEYTMSGRTLAEARDFYQTQMEEMLSGVDETWSDFEKALYINDYLASNFAYDTSYEISDAYNFFKSGVGVCQSYTMVYAAAMDALGIPNTTASSEAMNHVWNVIKIDGKWYHVDVTWNDPLYDRVGQALHDNFLKSDAYMSQNKHYGWGIYEGYTCTDTKYDASFMSDVRTPFVYLGGLWYYIDNSTGAITSWNTSTNKRTSVYQTNMVWSAGSGRYWSNKYSGLGLWGEKLIFNTEYEIKAYEVKTGSVETLHKQKDGKQIYGIAARSVKNTLEVRYQLATDPNTEHPTVKKLTLDNTVTYTLSGTVGGFLAGGDVTLTLMQNGKITAKKTLTSTGCTEAYLSFTFPSLEAGYYDLTITANGAFPYTVENIRVTANTDLSAKLGSIPIVSGDVSGNGIIDADDVAMLLDRATFHCTAANAATPSADLNGDGIIDIVDYAILTDVDRFGLTKDDCIKKAA